MTTDSPYIQPDLANFDHVFFNLDFKIYVGLVKDNRDPTRSGRLRVWVPSQGGDQNDENQWKTVLYAGPFIGHTYQDPIKKANGENSFDQVRHTYGMWFTGPDIGNLVLFVSAHGDPDRSYYFACLPSQFGLHMLPAMGSSDQVDSQKISDSTVRSLYQSGKIGPELPVAEFVEPNNDIAKFPKIRRPLHEPQVKILIEQGLDRPNYTGNRGRVTSSAQRETPSGVFGVATPGRPKGKYPDDTIPPPQRIVKTRLGGHTFVMDDGDNKGKNNLCRWRSSGGHQILFDDTDNILYICNSNGNAYVEMTSSGTINVYSSGGVNIRSKKTLNIHCDQDINVQADGNLNMCVKKTLSIEAQSINIHGKQITKLFGASTDVGASGSLSLSGVSVGINATSSCNIVGKPVNLNSGAANRVSKPSVLPVKSHDDTEKESSQWTIKPNKIKSIVSVVPTHEPWKRKTGQDSAASSTVSGDAAQGSDIDQLSAAQAGEGIAPEARAVAGAQAGEGIAPVAGAATNSGQTSNGPPEAGPNPVPGIGDDTVVGGNGLETQGGGVTQDTVNNENFGYGGGAFTAEQEKWLGGADRTDPYILARMPGINAAAGVSIVNGLTEQDLRGGISIPQFTNGLAAGRLAADQARGFAGSVIKQVSGGINDFVSKSGNLGKYAVNATQAAISGFIKRSGIEQYKGNNQVFNDPRAWTGLLGCKNQNDFLASTNAQDQCFSTNAQFNYNALNEEGIILPSDPSATVAGVLSCAHVAGSPDLAKRFFTRGGGQSSDGLSLAQITAHSHAAVLLADALNVPTSSSASVSAALDTVNMTFEFSRFSLKVAAFTAQAMNEVLYTATRINSDGSITIVFKDATLNTLIATMQSLALISTTDRATAESVKSWATSVYHTIKTSWN